MSTKADQLGGCVIVTGLAYVRIIEAADVLLDRQPVWTERLLLRLTRALCAHRLRGLVARLDVLSDKTTRVALDIDFAKELPRHLQVGAITSLLAVS